MYNNREIMETIRMIQEQNLDVRTVTMGISLVDCMDSDINKSCEKVYKKIYNYAKDLVKTGEVISKKYGSENVISIVPHWNGGGGNRFECLKSRNPRKDSIKLMECMVEMMKEVKANRESYTTMEM